MAVNRRWANAGWQVADERGNLHQGGAQLAVLMDIRDELQRLNGLLHCGNFTGIPMTLRSIRRAMPAKRVAKKKP